MPQATDKPELPAAADLKLSERRNSVSLRMQLLEGWAQLPEILDGISDGIITLDKAWRVTFVNHAVAGLVGKARAQLVGKLLWEELPELKDTSFGRAFAQAMTEGVALTLEDQLVPLKRWLEARAFPTPSGLTILVRDVTVRKEAETRAARRVGQLRALTEAALAMTSAAGLDERLRVCAVRAQELVGARQAAISLCTSGNWQDARHALARSQHFSKDPSALIVTGAPLFALVRDCAGAVRLSAQEVLRRPQLWDQARGGPPKGWLGAPLFGRDGQVIGLIQLSDKDKGEFDEEDEVLLAQLAQVATVTLENARLYEDARTHARRAEEVSRIKDEFLATVSHELRTPLTSIMGWTQMLRTRSFEPEKREKGLEIIERNARALKQLVEDLLDVSRIIAGKMRLEVSEMEPHRVVEAALDGVRPAATAKGVSLRAQLDAAAGPIRADAARIQQVVWNLLVNAIKFTPSGGQVEVELTAEESDVVISVKDSGEGIKPEFLPHLFERFRQADGSSSRVHGGLGLGLSIVRHLVEMHGGSVMARSAGQGHGATFTVRLPRVDNLDESVNAARKLAAGRASSSSRTILSGLKVLVVDDSDDAREIVATMLSAHGAQVLTAGGTDHAIEQLRTHRPHLLVSDICMPGEDGYRLLERVRALSPAEGALTPAIALTAYARAEDREHVLMAGFQAHVTKPIDTEDLVSCVAHAAGRTFARA